MVNVDLYLQSECELAEGPVWHDGGLWWVDIEAGRLHSSCGKQFAAAHSIGAAVPCTSGRWLLAEEEGLSFWDLEQAPQRFWTRPEPSPEYRFNDGKVAPDGTFWAGSLKRGTLAGDCRLYRLDRRLGVQPMRGNLGLCNGLEWDVERGLFYFVDSGAHAVFCCPTDAPERAAVFATFEQGVPDGMTIDAGGNLWVAMWGESVVHCLDRGTGRILQSLQVPAPHVSSCCFGGDTLDTLFITTARQGLSPAQLAGSPGSGSIFCSRPGVRGIAARPFPDKELT